VLFAAARRFHSLPLMLQAKQMAAIPKNRTSPQVFVLIILYRIVEISPAAYQKRKMHKKEHSFFQFSLYFSN